MPKKKHLRLVPPQPPAPRTTEEVLIIGRRCVEILEAPPEDFGQGYSCDEEARQWAACDRLVEVFRYLDQELTGNQDEGAGQQ